MPAQLDMWRQSGNVYSRRYRDNVRNYPGWHVTADKPGAVSLLELLAAFQSSPIAVQRTILVSAPTADVLSVPNNQNGRARWWAPSRWCIAFNPEPDASSAWSFPPDKDPAVLSVGREFLTRLTSGIGDLMVGVGDYFIGRGEAPPGEKTCLWFWWQVHSN